MIRIAFDKLDRNKKKEKRRLVLYLGPLQFHITNREARKIVSQIKSRISPWSK